MITIIPPKTDQDRERLETCRTAVITLIVEHYPNLGDCPEHIGAAKMCACRARSIASVLELLAEIKPAFALALGIKSVETDYKNIKPSDIFGEC